VKKSNAELIDDIRRSGMAIDTYWREAFPICGNPNLSELQQIESHANALAIYTKLLRQRLEAGQPTLAEGE
jgi:hypothetical protein